MVPTIFWRSRAWLSVKSANRSSTASSAPECSPALTMFTYSGPKIFWWLASASPSEEPSFTRCFTSDITRLRRSFSVWSTSAVSASTSATPAPSSVASWRVMIAMSSEVTRARVSLRRLMSCDIDGRLSTTAARLPVLVRPGRAPPSACPSTSVRKTPVLRSWARSVLAESASNRPVTDLPPSVSPLYSNTGIVAFLQRELEVLLRDAEHLGDGGLAVSHLDRAVRQQGGHALGDGLLLDAAGVHVLEDQLAHVVVHHQQLVDAGPPAVAVLVAGRAAHRAVEPDDVELLLQLLLGQGDLRQLLVGGLVLLPAVGAHPADQALGEDGGERGRHQERLHAHVHQSGDRAGGVVGVDGGEDEVAGERSLDGDLRGLLVADLAHHDHVRVLAEEGAQPGGEGEPDLRADRHLADALELVFDRVLDGEDVEVGRVDAGERAVQRGGLPGAGGAGDQDDPVRPPDERVHVLERLPGHADLRQVQEHGGLVQQAHHDALAERGGDGGDADVDVPAGELDPDAAVLGQALLGDVELRHDLHAAQDGALVALGRLDD